jgi:ABC-2 type transport system permease protein
LRSAGQPAGLFRSAATESKRNEVERHEPSAGDAIAVLAWCVGIALVGRLWSRATFSKRA